MNNIPMYKDKAIFTHSDYSISLLTDYSRLPIYFWNNGFDLSRA